MLTIYRKAVFIIFIATNLAISANTNGVNLAPGGKSILAENWFVPLPSSYSGAEFKLHKSGATVPIIHVSTSNNIIFRKPDNYPLTVKLAKSEFPPGTTVAIRFLYRGHHRNNDIEAFHTPPIMSVKASYAGKQLLDSRSIGRLELFPFWSEFRISFRIPETTSKDQGRKRRRRSRGNSGLAVTLFFGYMPEQIDVTGMDVRCYPPQKLDPAALLSPQAEGNSLIVFQNHSKTINVLWNDSHPAKRSLHVSAVRQPNFGRVTFDRETVTYTSTKSLEFGYDYFYYTVSDNSGNSQTAPVKVIVTPDFLDGSWNIGHDYKNFPHDLASDGGTPVCLRRFVKPYTMGIAVGRVIKELEKQEQEGSLPCSLKMAVFPFAKRGPNGENMEPCGVYWDLPHSIDSTFCLPIMHSMGCVVNPTFKGPHNHDIRSFRMKFSVKQRCINTDDRKVRFFFKTHDNSGDIGIGYRAFTPGAVGSTIKGRRGGSTIIKIGSHLYKANAYQAALTCKDTNGDGVSDKCFTKDGTPLKQRYGGGRLLAPVKDVENFSVDFDMKKYFDWCEEHGWLGGGHISYLFNGSEMGSIRASKGRMKGAGIMLFDNVDYWLSTDIPAKHPIPDIELSNNGKVTIIKLRHVFDRIYPENLDGSIPKLRYVVENITGGNLLRVIIKGKNLALIPEKGKLGKIELTIKAVDDTWHWDDIESFSITLVNKAKVDNDHDGISDEIETYKTHTNPIFSDSDFDGLSDRDEIVKYKTKPMDPDCDDDGLSDGDEILAKTDPHRKDSDGDGISDGREVLLYKSNPLKRDSDGDGYSDATEIKYGMDPSVPYRIFAKYNFDAISKASIKDISRQGHNLFVHRRLGLRKGKLGKALFCNGSRAALFTTDSETPTTATGYTLGFWVNPGKKDKPSAIFSTPNFAILSDAGNFIYVGKPPPGTPRRWAGRGPHTRPPANIKRIIAPCQTGQWTYISLISDGKKTVILLNGVVKKVIKGVSNGGFTKFMIGGDITRTYPNWKGLIDELVIAPKPYSRTEIKHLMQP
jgi:hypothetical protein